MGRSPCCSKEGLNRGAWTVVEDKILTEYIRVHGEGRWRSLPKKAGLKRCGKSCRLRWLNYLRPDIKRGNISLDEEDLIVRLHRLLGNRWSLIAGRLPGRTDNEIKNYWNTNLGKKTQSRQTQSADRSKNKSAALAPPPPTNPKISPPAVIRTKATRCSKVFISPPTADVNATENTSTGRPEPEPEPELAAPPMAGDLSTGVLTDTLDFSMDFMADINMGELCLSDLLNNNFDENGNELCGSSDGETPLMMLCKEMVEDWSSLQGMGSYINYPPPHPNPNMASNLSSLLDSEGDDWLGD